MLVQPTPIYVSPVENKIHLMSFESQAQPFLKEYEQRMRLCFLFHSVVPSSSSFTIATHTAGLLLHTSIDLKGAVRQDVHCAIYCRGGTSQSKTSNLQLFFAVPSIIWGGSWGSQSDSGGSIAPLATPVAPPLSVCTNRPLRSLAPPILLSLNISRSARTGWSLARSAWHTRYKCATNQPIRDLAEVRPDWLFALQLDRWLL